MTNEDRERINRSDLEKINAAADYLNAEMEDVLSYQADPFENEDLDQDLLQIVIRVPISDAEIEK